MQPQRSTKRGMRGMLHYAPGRVDGRAAEGKGELKGSRTSGAPVGRRRCQRRSTQEIKQHASIDGDARFRRHTRNETNFSL